MTHQAFTTLLLAASLLVPGASALGGSHWRGAMHNGKFWKKSDVRKELHLTDDEVRNFDRIFARDQNMLKDLKADVEKRREDLDAMLVADKVDDKQVLDQVARDAERSDTRAADEASAAEGGAARARAAEGAAGRCAGTQS